MTTLTLGIVLRLAGFGFIGAVCAHSGMTWKHFKWVLLGVAAVSVGYAIQNL